MSGAARSPLAILVHPQPSEGVDGWKPTRFSDHRVRAARQEAAEGQSDVHRLHLRRIAAPIPRVYALRARRGNARASTTIFAR